MKLKSLLIVLLVLFASINVFAEGVEIDGIYYNFNEDEAEVTSVNKSYGSVVILSSVTYNGKTYSVTSIASNSFGNDATRIKDITIPESVTYIAYGALDRTGWYLKQPDGLVYAGKVAYKYRGIMPSGTHIDIEEGTLSISPYAFNDPNSHGVSPRSPDCSGLTSITIPNSVKFIGYAAFGNCSSLTSITFPDNAMRIGRMAFYNTPWYNNQPEGLVYVGKIAYRYKGIMPDDSQITIKQGTLGIADGAFDECKGLTSVTIPGSVTSIGDWAFAYCSNLTTVAIPGSVKSIGKGAFEDCCAMTSIAIESGVTRIGERAFNRSGLTSVTIPNSVTSIGVSAFEYCRSMTSVSIGSGVKSIGDKAFNNCTALTAVHITDLAAWCNISFGVNNSQPLYLAHHLYLNGHEITDLVIPNGVTSIGNRTFDGCSGLTSVSIPNSVTSIGDAAFYGCSGLTSVSIPNNVTSIGYSAFSNSTGMTSVTIGNSVTSIGNYAFGGCSGLTDFYCCAEEVPSAASNAFSNSNCGTATLHVPTGSVEAYRTTAPWSGFGTIEGYFISFADAKVKALCVANWDTDSDKELSINEAAAVTDLGTVFKGNKQISSFSELSFFTGLTSISSYDFSQCTALTSIAIPSSVTSIGNYAFQGCIGLSAVYITDLAAWCNISFGNGSSQPLSSAHRLYLNGQEITDLAVPEGVTSIADYAFKGCTGLTTAIISKNVISIGNSVFSDCNGLTTVYIPNSVTSVGSLAFYKCTALTEVYCYAEEVPDTKSNAFSSSSIGAATLHVLDIAEETYRTTAPWSNFGTIVPISSFIIFADPKVKEICIANWDTNSDGELTEEEAAAVPNLGTVFKKNTQITSFNELQYFTGLTSIDNSAFDGCNGLTSITIPNSVTSIGGSAFARCSSLTSVTIPNSVTSIGGSAFNGCSGLTSFTIPNSVTSIFSGAFNGCSSLTSITIPDGVISIEGSTFKNCTFLTSITITENLTSIGSSAFENCHCLKSITIPESVLSIGSRAFKGCYFVKENFINNSLLSDKGDQNWGATLCSSETSDGLLITGRVLVFCRPWAPSIAIPNSVTSIGNDAFEFCNLLTSVIIPESVISIGDRAFAYCCELTNVYCYATSIPTTGSGVFTSTPIVSATLHVPASSREAYRITAPWSGFGTIVAIDGDEPSPAIVFADANVKALCVSNWDSNGDGELSEAEAAAVTDLGEVFKENTTITSFNELQYFTGLTSIGGYAFYLCNSLTSITIPENVTSIGSDAFGGCNGLKAVHITDLTAWCNIHFELSVLGFSSSSNTTSTSSYEYFQDAQPLYYAKHLYLYGQEIRDLVIPEGVSHISDYAFYGCTGLTSITFPESVKSVGGCAFRECTGLTAVHITDLQAWSNIEFTKSLSSIIETTYYWWASQDGEEKHEKSYSYWKHVQPLNYAHHLYLSGQEIKELVIPDGITKIRTSCYEGCSSFTSITIPNSVTSIGGDAFSDCSGIFDVYCYAENVPSAESGAFDNSNIASATLHVPEASLNAYRTAAPWNGFGSIVALDEDELSPAIVFADANVKALCVAYWDANGDGELNKVEAVAVTDLGTVFRGNTSITSFNELQYFTGLDSICSNAFRDCRSLTSVILPSSVTSICVGTFRATGLTSITIPNSVTSIEQDAFCDCQDLTTVTIPGSVANIGKAAFYVCRKLSSVTLGTGVESIGNNAFHYCSSLTSISIPNSVRSIGFCSFADCAMTSITIPNSVTSIDGYAFAGNANLTSVTMPDNIITFTGGWAFGDNNNIESVYITNLATWLGTAFPSGNNPLRSGAKLYLNNVEVKDLIIPEGTTAILAAAFEGCESLTSVTIPSSVTSIDGWAFASCSNLISITIPNSVTTIGDCAFRSTAITSLTIPASVTNIAVSANSGGLTEDCTSLMNIYVEEGNSRYYSENGVLFTEDEEFVGANGKAIVLFPQGRRGSYEIPNDVTVIGSRAFVSCKGLTSVVIPEGVTTIEGEYAFHGCENLTSVTIPSSMTSIGDGSFFNNHSLADVFCYAENVPETSSWAFYGSPLSSATLHVPVGSIDAYSTTAPWSGFGTIVAIEDNSNMEINGIYYALDKNNRTAEVISNPNGYSGTVVIPESVTFSNNTYSVTSIGEGAFAGCEGLTSITIPNSVTSISQNAFAGITIRKVFWLTNTPPSGYENLKGYINYVLNNSYSSLSNVRVYPYLASMFELNGVKYVPVSPSEHICDAVDCVQNETAKDLNISSVTYQGITMKVKNVMPYLAYENKYIESLSVDIEGNIPIRAFDNCSNLKSVNLGEKVTGIGEYAFYGCISLSSITIGSSVTSIGNSAFRECSGLTSVSIPGSVTSIGESAFSDCKGLTSINIPEGLTSIGYRTFYGCSSLTSIKIPNSVTSIDNSAFSSCIDLTSVTIGNGVTNIGNYVFSNCSSLTSITIPDAVTSISYRAFSGCSRLTEIYCLAEEVPVTSLNAFDNTPINNVTLHVPASAIDKYKATKPWSGFGTIVTIEKRESITMTDEFATFSCSEDLDFSGSDLRAYIASGFNKATNQVLLTRIKDVPAGTGIFLVGKPGTTYTIPYAETSSIYMNFFQANLETSTIYATTDNYSNYIFGEQSGEIGFYPVVDYETLLAQTAYLQLPSSFVAAGVKVNVVFEEDIIDGIEDFRISDSDETIYDLAGRRLGKIQRGINIVNGKKVMVK